LRSTVNPKPDKAPVAQLPRYSSTGDSIISLNAARRGAMDKTDLALSEMEPNPFAGEEGQISLIHATRRYP
jgi:hypothetical protein